MNTVLSHWRETQLLDLKMSSCVFPFFSFAAYAVIANGQVECPKGYKRMNLTHCQGKLWPVSDKTPPKYCGSTRSNHRLMSSTTRWHKNTSLNLWFFSQTVPHCMTTRPLGTRPRVQPPQSVKGQRSASYKPLGLLL